MRRFARALSSSVVVGMLGTVIGCGAGQTRGHVFDARWSDEGGARLATFERHFRAKKVPLGVGVAVFVQGKGVLAGVPLSGHAPWAFTHALEGRPAVAGSVVVGIGAGELFALDATTGKRLWVKNTWGHLRGIGDDGVTTVVSLLPVTGRGSVVLAVDHDGIVVRQIEDDASIGVPAIVDGHAFLPWGGTHVTIYDLRAGEERARLVFRQPMTHAFTEGGALFFGDRGVTRFDEAITGASTGSAPFLTLPPRELPGDPQWLRPVTDALPARVPQKVGVYAGVTPTGALRFEDDRYVVSYLRLAMGLDAKSGAVAWVDQSDADVLGGGPYQGGTALCDAAGRVRFFDAMTGGVAGELATGKPAEACVLQADAVKKDAPRKPVHLAEQLAAALRLKGDELVPAQRVLLKELVKLDDPLVTKTLVELTANASTPPELLADVHTALAARQHPR